MSGAALALFGHPVAHSRSPAIHAAFAEQFGWTVDYRLIDVTPDGFAAAAGRFFADGGRGANVTVPHKAAAFAICEQLTPEARHAWAVNTLWHRDGRLQGHNTDGIGLRRDLEANLGITLRGRQILICGAGGAAHGILGPLLAREPAQIHIANRTLARAEALAARDSRCRAITYAQAAGDFDLILNATSLSLQNAAPPLPDGCASGSLAYDLVYADEPTPFMQWAAANGAARVADGWGMLVEQAAESFVCWFGDRPDSAPLLHRESLTARSPQARS